MNQSKKDFQKYGICRLKNAFSSDLIKSLESETEILNDYVSDLSNVHSTYKHIKPSVFSKAKMPAGGWKLLNLYHSPEFKSLVDGITGLDVSKQYF